MKPFKIFRRPNPFAWIAAGVLVLSLAACGSSDGTDAQTTTLSASLSGDQEPTPTVTGAIGTGTLSLSLPSLELSGSVALNAMVANAAHVHLGDVGVNGPVIVPLAETTAGSGVWAVPAGTMITEAQATAFNAGGLYFNAHSTDNPGGEIRGQIGRQVHAAQLTASQEVPANSTTATGNGLVSFDPATKKFTARLTLSGMTATAAHIHPGAVGVNGPVLFPLSETAAGSGVWVSAADAVLTDAQITMLNTGGLYFNAHSTAFPGGQIRGQVGLNVRHASLSAAQEVPPNASVATGTGTLVVNPATRAATGGIVITGMTATAAHIHLGALGVNGSINIHLVNDGAGVWSVPANTVLSAEQLKAYKQGNLYFNAHSAASPGGEIRGQIR